MMETKFSLLAFKLFNGIKLKIINMINPQKVQNEYNHILKIIFEEKNLNPKLENFIIHNTKHYDTGEISYKEYSEKLQLFLKYLAKKEIDTEMIEEINHLDTKQKMMEHAKFLNWNININHNTLMHFINAEKEAIYSRDLKNRLGIEGGSSEEKIISKFIDYYGDKSLVNRNILTLSQLLDQKTYDVKSAVSLEYDKILKAREIEHLEQTLFGSHLNNEFLTIEHIDSLDGFEFEDYLKELFEGYGYTCEELPYTNDYGADLIISKGIDRIVIQAKNYSGNVGNTAIQEVLSAKAYYKCDLALVITNAYFTRNAIEMAKKTHVILIGRDELMSILENGALYFNSLLT